MQDNSTEPNIQDGLAAVELLKLGHPAQPAAPQGPGNDFIWAIAHNLWNVARNESRTSAEDEQAAVSLEHDRFQSVYIAERAGCSE